MKSSFLNNQIFSNTTTNKCIQQPALLQCNSANIHCKDNMQVWHRSNRKLPELSKQGKMPGMMGGEMEQADDDGRLPMLLMPFHPYQCLLPARIQKLEDRAEDPSDVPGNKHPSPPQAPCVPSPSQMGTGITSTPSRFTAQETCIILIKQRNECSQLMDITQLHQKQGAVHFLVSILIPFHYQQVLTFPYNILKTEMQLYTLLSHLLHGGEGGSRQHFPRFQVLLGKVKRTFTSTFQVSL